MFFIIQKQPQTLFLLSVAITAAFLVSPVRAEAELSSPPPAMTNDNFHGIILKFKNPAVRIDILSTLDGRENQLPTTDAPLYTLSSMAGGAPLTYDRAMSLGFDVIKLAPETSMNSAEAIAEQLAKHSEIEFAVLDRIAHTMMTPNDPRYVEQWHYHLLGAGNYGLNLPAAWDISTGASSVVVAVLDTGITTHEDFDASRIVTGYDFLTNISQANDGDGRDNDPSDPGDCTNSTSCKSSWHGTHVTGTIGASTDNGVGVSGVDWKSKILPVRVLGVGGGPFSDVIDGMVWASGGGVPGVPANPNPAKVLNLSLGGQGQCDAAMQNAVNAVTSAGSVVVVSAGNSNADASGFSPASCNGVITVAATTQTGSKAYYSNYGSTVDISAPGGAYGVDTAVLSTINTGLTAPALSGYSTKQGTSMAAPHVSGLVSLMLSVNPNLTPANVLALLQQNSTPFPASGGCTTANCGSGIANAAATLNALAEPPPGDTQPSPFGWATITDVASNSWVTSQPIVLNGLDTSAPFTVSNGFIILNCGSSGRRGSPSPSEPLASGVITPGTAICARHLSSAVSAGTTTTSVKVNNVTGTFTSVTKASAPLPPPTPTPPPTRGIR